MIRFKHFAFRIITLYLILFAIFTAAIYGVYCIPHTMIEKNAMVSKKMIEEESQYQEWEKNKIQIIYNRDYFTDYFSR